MQTFSLYELHEHLRRAIALNFPESVWVSCEIAAQTESRGHHFLSLLEKGEGERELLAQSDAIIWQRTYKKLRKEIGKELPQLLRRGQQVRLKVKVDFHERFGFKLIIEEIDLTYTIGQLELQKRAILERLQSEQLIGKNAQLRLPKVIQRIAVLSAEQAAGWKDFEAHLQQNSLDYQFDIQLFTVALQGVNVRKEVLQQLKKIKSSKANFDVVVIIRGGGARLDLTAFDDYEIGKAVAQFPLAVLTGIGHEIDENLLDLVAHRALKTPTAAADFILYRNSYFETQMLQHFQLIQQLVQQKIQQQTILLTNLDNQIKHSVENSLRFQQLHLAQLQKQVPNLINLQLKQANTNLQKLTQLSTFLSLDATLKRGFTILTKNGKVMKSASDLELGETVNLRFEDGERVVKVKE